MKIHINLPKLLKLAADGSKTVIDITKLADGATLQEIEALEADIQALVADLKRAKEEATPSATP